MTEAAPPNRVSEIRPPRQYLFGGVTGIAMAMVYAWAGRDQLVAPSQIVPWVGLVVFHSCAGAIFSLYGANWTLLVRGDGLQVRTLLRAVRPLVTWAELRSVRRGGMGDLVIEQRNGKRMCVPIAGGARDLVERLRSHGVSIDLSLELRPLD